MKRYMKFGALALVAILAITASLTAAVSADSPDEAADNNRPGQAFAAKVAEKLGLDEGQVANAFAEARQEMVQERQQDMQQTREERLQQAIEQGRITQEEADEMQEWWDSRPEALKNMGQPGPFEMRNMRCHQ